MTILEGVVVGLLLERDSAGLPEVLLTDLLLLRPEFRNEGVMALGHVLVPALLDVLLLHVVD